MTTGTKVRPAAPLPPGIAAHLAPGAEQRIRRGIRAGLREGLREALDTTLGPTLDVYRDIRALADNADLDDATVGRKVREIMAEAER